MSSVGFNRIRGLISQELAPTTELLDIVVTVGIQPATLTDAFRYLLGPGLEPGRWEDLPPVPGPLGEVAGAVIFGQIYVVGEGLPTTFIYDLLNGWWEPDGAVRPFIGHHHSAEVIDGKLYLIGSLGGDGGRVQFYDPVADTWTEGDSMPWNAGSVQTCVIDGKLYAAGGIVGSSTVANVWRYDPAIDQWDAGPLADIPTPVNHAAAATDGTRFYVFGGRAGPNEVQPGLKLKVGDLVEITSKGRHTTSRATLLKLDIGGYVVDTPGVRSFDLSCVPRELFEQYYVEFLDHVPQCKFPDCTHVHEDGCAVKRAVLSGEIHPDRFESYVRLFTDVAYR